MYLFAIAIGLCCVYIGLLFFFPYFFGQKNGGITRGSIISFGLLFLLSITAYWIAYSIPDPVLGNRVLHSLGGGFSAFIACWLAIRDSEIRIDRVRFVILSILIVSCLGIANEIMEFMLQSITGVVYADSINDTWLDLISNTVGIVVAAVIFVPFIKSDPVTVPR